MKLLTFSRRHILCAIRAACLALFFAACIGRAGADPTFSGEFNVNGSNVTVLSSANNTTTAFFADPSPNAYAFTIQSGAKIGNTGGNLLSFDSGTVTTSGTLTASNYAIAINNVGNTTGTVTNSGSITGSVSGVYIHTAGTVNNTGQIGGASSGVHIAGDGSIGTVANSGAGSITASNGFGVLMDGSGTVNNSGTANITGSVGGIHILGAGTVNNTGTASIIGSSRSGIYIGGTGTVTNTGSIYGSHSGVYINNAGSVTNSGSITGQERWGIIIFGAGTIMNSGTITGNSGSSFSGIYTWGNGTVTNTQTGTITGYYGAELNDGGTVTNAGKITGTQAGVYIVGNGAGTGSVTNSGTISGYYGVKVNTSGTVTNSSSITGNTTSGNAAGVLMGSGTVTNNSTGTISGYYGVRITGAGAVTNSGSITGNDQGGGISLGSGTVTNNSGGTISGPWQGVQITGDGTVTNSGTITASGYNGVGIGGTGRVTNSSSGVITGLNGIVAVGDNSAVVNNGTITGSNYGVLLKGNDSSLLSASGKISGGVDSVLLSGSNSSVTVTGRAEMQGMINGGNTANDNTLTLDLAGMTSQQAAIAKAQSGQSSGSFEVGSGASEYTVDWSNFTDVNVEAISLEMEVDSGLKAVASKIDNGLLPSSYTAFYTASTSNPEAALNFLVGRQFDDAVGTINVNTATTLSDLFDSRAFDLRSGAGGFDLSGLSVTPGSMIASLGQMNNTLDRMTGNSILSGTTISDSRQDITGQPADSTRWGAWASGTVTLADESSTATSTGYNVTSGSPTIGVDYKISPNFAVGVLANYTTTGADFGDGSHLNEQTGLGALYGTWADGPWYINGLVGAGYSTYDNQRNVSLGGAGTANSSPDGNQVMANVTGGRDFKLGYHVVLSPEVGVLYTHVTENSYAESGAGIYDLNQAEQNIDSLRTKVGFHISDNIDWEGIEFTPEVRAAWYHECLDDSRGVTTSLAGAPTMGSFVVQTNSQGRDFAIVGLGLAASPTKNHNVTFFLNYDVQVGQDNYLANTINGGLRYNF